MKPFMKRLTSLAMTVVLSAASLWIQLPVSADEPAAPVYPSYAEAKEGDLLYTADFSGTDGRYQPALLNTDNCDAENSSWQALDEGASLSLTVPESKEVYFGGAVSGLPLDSNAVYTVTYDVERVEDALAGLYVDFNQSSATPRGRSGMGGYVSQYAYWVAGGNISGYKKLEELAKVKNPEVGEGKAQSYKLVVDVPNNMLSASVLAEDGQYITIVRTKIDPKLSGDTLNLIFRVFNGKGKPVKFGNINIYKGNVTFNTCPVLENGQLLLDIGNLSENVTGANGAVYTANVNDLHRTAKVPVTLVYDETTGENRVISAANPDKVKKSTTAVGGSTNLPLGAGHQYTLDYQIRFIKSSCGAGVRYAYGTTGHSDGPYMTTTQACVAYGTATANSGNVPYVKFTEGMLTPDENGFFRVSVEIDGNQITVFVNGEKLLTHDTTTNKKGVPGYTSDTLSVVFEQICSSLPENATEYLAYKNIKVYSGLTVSNGYVRMKNGETETVWAYPKSAGGILPLPKLNGMIFKGWAVDGNRTDLLHSGDRLPEGAEQIESVWGAPYLKAFAAQFKDNDNHTQDMRVVGIVDSLNYEEIGYRMVIRYTINGEEKTVREESIALHRVYDSLSAKYGEETVTVESLGYDPASGYLTAFTVKGIPTNIGTVTVELTAYSMTAEQEAPVYQQETTVITLVNGEWRSQ